VVVNTCKQSSLNLGEEAIYRYLFSSLSFALTLTFSVRGGVCLFFSEGNEKCLEIVLI